MMLVQAVQREAEVRHCARGIAGCNFISIQRLMVSLTGVYSVSADSLNIAYASA
jgi:hypothetical protein